MVVVAVPLLGLMLQDVGVLVAVPAAGCAAAAIGALLAGISIAWQAVSRPSRRDSSRWMYLLCIAVCVRDESC